MDNIQDRLARCFETVFPDLQAADIPKASQETMSAWDSVAAITLVNVLEDEFGFQIDFDRLSELNSFDRIFDYIKSQVQA